MDNIIYDDQQKINSFFKINKILFDDYFSNLSIEAKMLYSILLDRAKLSMKNNWKDKNGETYIIFTNKDLCKMLGKNEKTIINMKKELEKYGLLKETRQGLNKPNLLYITLDIAKTVGTVKFTVQELDNLQFKNCKNYSQVRLSFNKTNNNKTNTTTGVIQKQEENIKEKEVAPIEIETKNEVIENVDEKSVVCKDSFVKGLKEGEEDNKIEESNTTKEIEKEVKLRTEEPEEIEEPEELETELDIDLEKEPFFAFLKEYENNEEKLKELREECEKYDKNNKTNKNTEQDNLPDKDNLPETEGKSYSSFDAESFHIKKPALPPPPTSVYPERKGMTMDSPEYKEFIKNHNNYEAIMEQDRQEEIQENINNVSRETSKPEEVKNQHTIEDVMIKFKEKYGVELLKHFANKLIKAKGFPTVYKCIEIFKDYVCKAKSIVSVFYDFTMKFNTSEAYNKCTPYNNDYSDNKPVQATNYEQREYDDDEWDYLYDNSDTIPDGV